MSEAEIAYANLLETIFKQVCTMKPMVNRSIQKQANEYVGMVEKITFIKGGKKLDLQFQVSFERLLKDSKMESSQKTKKGKQES